jgi:ADP-heptose:LPS heptosyltransferase
VRVDPNSVRSILVIKLRGVGDVLLSTIVTKNLRLAFPEARIDYLTEPPGSEVLEGNPFLDRIVVFDRKTMTGWDLISQIRGMSYSMVIDLFGNPRTALVTRLSGARFRVGFRFRLRRHAYNIVVEPRGALVHNTQFNLDALEAIGVAIQDRNLYFPVALNDEEYVDRFLRDAGLGGGLIGALNSSGGWYTKRWQLEKFAMLADRLVERYEASIVITWGPGELEEAKKLKLAMDKPAFVPPPTSLKQLGALFKRCSFLVTNDSGPMHIAAAVGTPVLGIYGPTNPRLQGPYGERHLVVRNEAVPCLGCNLTSCPIGHPCMLELSVDRVLEHVDRLLRMNDLIR